MRDRVCVLQLAKLDMRVHLHMINDIGQPVTGRGRRLGCRLSVLASIHKPAAVFKALVFSRSV